MPPSTTQAVLHSDTDEETKKRLVAPKVAKRKSTLERLHLGFIARLIGRTYASDEEETKRSSK